MVNYCKIRPAIDADHKMGSWRFDGFQLKNDSSLYDVVSVIKTKTIVSVF